MRTSFGTSPLCLCDLSGCACRAWLLLRLAVTHQHLQSLNAFISTLGGGHFLCKHLTAARELAEKQIAVARAMGDEGTAARCAVHIAYGSIMVGSAAACSSRWVAWLAFAPFSR